MEFTQLLQIVGDEPVFETGLLLAGRVDPADVRRQLSRWCAAGRLIQLRRGLYMLAPPFQKVKPHPFVIANAMVRGSYVSCQSALAHYGNIPEVVPAVTSVGAARPSRRRTPLGDFLFHHLKPALMHGYRRLALGGGQHAFVATPAKALLDLIHLQPGGDTAEYLAELRLQELERLDLAEVQRLADRSGRPKLKRAARRLAAWAGELSEEYETV
jgi:predicted transcriptional regulator of viral defense system